MIPSPSKNTYSHTTLRTHMVKLSCHNLTLTTRNLRGSPTNVPRLRPRRPKIHQTHSNSLTQPTTNTPTTIAPARPTETHKHKRLRQDIPTHQTPKRQRPVSPESIATSSAQTTSRRPNNPALKDPAEPHPDSINTLPASTSSTLVHQPTTTHYIQEDVRSEGYQRRDHTANHTGTSPTYTRQPKGPPHPLRRPVNRGDRNLTLPAQTRYDIGTRLPEDHWHYNIGPDGPRFTDGGSMQHY